MINSAGVSPNGWDHTMPLVVPGFAPNRAVIDALSSAVGRLATVVAPAGYGKSSHVSTWARADGRPVAWIDADRSHNDLRSLLIALLGALEPIVDIDTRSLRTLPQTSSQFDTVTVPELGRVIRATTTPFIMVIDDAHLIDSPSVAGLLTEVAHNIAPPSTVVLIGRGEPHTSLSRIRAYDGVVEVSTPQLSLDVDGAGALLASMGVDVQIDDLARLVEDTEGWPIGIRMIGLAPSLLRGGRSRQVSSVGHDRVIAEFVREQWLADLPDDTVHFLMQISGFDRLSGPLCDAALASSGSGERLDRLSQNSSMLIPLDRRGADFRMHRLLRDVLDDMHVRRDADGRRGIDHRASEWFERNGDIDRAIDHSVRAGDIDRAAHLITVHTPTYVTANAGQTVDQWLGLLPVATVTSSAALCLGAATRSITLGDDEATRAWLRIVTKLRDAGSVDPITELRFDALLASLGTSADADMLQRSERAYLQLETGPWHVLASLAFGMQSFAINDEARASSVLAEGSAEARLLGTPSLEAQCRAYWAMVLSATGHTRRATDEARTARAIQRDHQLDDRATLVTVTAMSALVEARWGNPKAARADALLTRQNLMHLAPVVDLGGIDARLTLAEAFVILGDHTAAQTLLHEVEPLVRRNPFGVRAIEALGQLTDQMRLVRTVLPYGPSSLSTAELRLLHYLPTNLTLAEIAARLFVSRNTVKSHAAAVYRKLGVASRSEAVELARSIGLL
jgi:LuxR family transcriptional regulator, maltose regulon positive regulatory protein